jgi:hypothetical protein
MNEFEERLSECLEALTEGRWDLDECLRRYPEHAAELRTHLASASMLARSYAYGTSPREEWAAQARERFLIATGQRLQESMDVEPEPSFFAAARIRFLLAAQRVRMERAEKRQPRRMPVFGSPMRALGGLAAAIAIFATFSTYTVATADAALPGDWRYPVKLQTERVRLALAFSDDQKHEVNLDIAEERLQEIERLASKGRIIGPGVLNRLAEQTKPLVDDASAGKLNSDDVARLEGVSIKSAQVLNAVQSQVDPDAQAQLDEAKVVSAAGVSVTLALRPLLVITPEVVVSTQTPVPPTAEPTDSEGTPTIEPTVGAGETVVPADTPEVGDVPSSDVIFGDEVFVDLGGIKLHTLIAGRLRLLAPGPGTGWYLADVPQTGVPSLIKLQTQDQQSFIVISTNTGNMYWYISAVGNSRYDEVQMHITKDGQLSIADAADLRARYGSAADIPILVMQSIELLEAPTPTPEPTETPIVSPTP